MRKLPPEDTEIVYCGWCDKYHGTEVFCPTTFILWIRYWRHQMALFVDRWLERFAYSIAIFALICFALALLIGLIGLVW